MKKAIPFILLVLAAVFVLVIKKCKNNDKPSSISKTTNKVNPAGAVNRDHGFDRRISFIEYTKHARCRMDCRHITQAEVEDIMRNGDINYRKSEVDDKPCPVYALEGFVNNEKLRIVFAQCDQKTKVVTVIDLDKEWQCDCPGDDKKYKNRN